MSMLFALTFGMFVIVGLLLRTRLRPPLGRLVVAPGAFFLLCRSRGLFRDFWPGVAVLSKANYSTLRWRGVEKYGRKTGYGK